MTIPWPLDHDEHVECGDRVVIRAFSHYAGNWPAEQRLRVNTAGHLNKRRDASRDHWRTPLDLELARLTGSAPGDTEPLMVEVFTLPNHLRTDYWDLDMDQVFAGSDDSAEYRAFAARVLEYMEFIGVPVDLTCTFRTEISPPGGEPPWNDANSPVGNTQTSPRHPLAEPPTAMINLGFEPRAVVWPKPDRLGPWVKLSLEPGEGCFGPFRRMRLIQDTSDMTEPDFNLIIEPAPAEQHVHTEHRENYRDQR